jgi:hypothetical protein
LWRANEVPREENKVYHTGEISPWGLTLRSPQRTKQKHIIKTNPEGSIFCKFCATSDSSRAGRADGCLTTPVFKHLPYSCWALGGVGGTGV